MRSHTSELTRLTGFTPSRNLSTSSATILEWRSTVSLRRSAQMRRQDDVVQGQQGVSGRDWMRLEDVDAGSSKTARLKSLHEGFTVHDARVGRIDQI